MDSTLFYGDNLPVMRGHLSDASVDLVYLDPPFNSQRNYNVLFKEQSGDQSPAQIKAFTDTWEWSERAYDDFLQECRHPQLVELLRGMVHTLGRNYVTAYLAMMAPRLAELHRVLKPTGSLYLHCDPTASHYLKLLLDAVFGARCYRNEMVWKRTTAHSDSRRAGRIHDLLLFYTRTDDYTWNAVYQPYDDGYVERYYRYTEPDGRRYASGDVAAAGPGPARYFRGERRDPPRGSHWRFSQEKIDEYVSTGRIYFTPNGFPRYKRYLDEMEGTPLQDLWTDALVRPVVSWSKEGLGYPTQKPVALLERIIRASSNPGDLVLDPFCGCGTAVVAAQGLGRRWIGIDVAHVAVALIKYRLADSFDLQPHRDYAVVGEPTTEAEARALANDDRDEFQKWAVGLVPRAMLFQHRKGADTGVDGLLYFKDDTKDPKKVVIQVKSGHVSVALARDFAHVIDRDKATLGLFVTLDPPTGPMRAEADAMGFYTTPLGGISIPRFQFRTIAQLLAGNGFHVPSTALLIGVTSAPKATRDTEQEKMTIE